MLRARKMHALTASGDRHAHCVHPVAKGSDE
jgi:hypothetical protein